MLLKVVFIFLTLVMSLAAIDETSYEKLGYGCTPGAGGDIDCSLKCLFYLKYKAGICNPEDSACWCELEYKRLIDSREPPEPLGPCTRVFPDANCGLRCLFYPRYNGGFCNEEENTCYCTRS